MKKLFALMALCLVGFPLVNAAEITVMSMSDSLIRYADQAIDQGKISVDNLLTAMYAFHETQKSELKTLIEQEDFVSAQATLDQRNQMYPLTMHLHALQAGNGAQLTHTNGATYTFKKQTLLPRLNVSRGEDVHYSFPKHDTFLELQRNTNTT
jgi:hypothetical protein